MVEGARGEVLRQCLVLEGLRVRRRVASPAASSLLRRRRGVKVWWHPHVGEEEGEELRDHLRGEVRRGEEGT